VENPEAFERDELLVRFWGACDRAGQLAYSDGDGPEDRLLAHVLALERDEDADLACEALVQDWPSQYHCDPARRNLLRPVAHLIRGRVLEIGAGCGALTGFLADRAEQMVALEGAHRRARIVAARHRHRTNLAVLACALSQFRPVGQYDTVAVTGVLEYAPMFMDAGPDAARAFLDSVRAALAPGGTLLLAIENQLGLSYIGGMPEDHVGQPWFGVEDRYGPAGFRTFGRRALEGLLARAGLLGQSWYYPFPDYKLPVLVLAEAALQASGLDAAEMIAQVVPDRQFRPVGPGFAPTLAWKVAGENGMIADLADSFLVAATAGPVPPATDGGLAWVFSTQRRPAFRKVNRIGERGGTLVVERAALAADIDPPADAPVRQVLADEPFQPGPLYMDALRLLCATAGLPQAAIVAAWAQDWLAYLRAHVGPTGTLPTDFLDCIPANLIRTPAGCLFFFDREWHAIDAPSIDYVVFRGLVVAYLRISDVLQPRVAGPPLLTAVAETMSLLGLSADLSPFCDAESRLQEAVTGVARAQIMASLKANRVERPSVAGRAGAATLMSAYEDLLRSHKALAMAALRGLLGDVSGPVGCVDGVTQVAHGTRVVSGWAWDRVRGTPADLVVLFVDGKPTAVAPLCICRPDAARAVGGDSELLGFTIPLPDTCGTVSPGNAAVVAWSKSSMGILQWTSADGREG
jgi:hypothetical protein